MQFEKNGEKFSMDVFLAARQQCIQITNVIVAKIKTGMVEKDIKELIESEFKAIGVQKFWHPTKIRIGTDTTKTFRDISDPTIAVRPGEICFLDIGPIIQDHEADYGKTFLAGSSDTNHLIDSCLEIFKKTAAEWKNKKTTGEALFAFADHLAKEYGYELNPLMAGHRLGDFPHQIHSSEKLFGLNMVPSKNLWILEIHIRDAKNNIGAFFEDILGAEDND